MCRSSERVSESIRHDFGFRGGGGDREGPVAPLSWGPRAPSWAFPSHASRGPSLFSTLGAALLFQGGLAEKG